MGRALIFVALCFVGACVPRGTHVNKRSAAVPTPSKEEPLPQTPPESDPPVKQEPKIASIDSALHAICLNKAGSPAREEALEWLNSYKPGTRAFDIAQAQGKDPCVTGLLPAALYVNLKAGIPAGILLGQAIQESGWCSTNLARNNLNFHAEKIPSGPREYTYWKGEGASGYKEFKHPDFSFYTVAETLNTASLPYRKCFNQRKEPEKFIACVATSWAADGAYATKVLKHRASYQSSSIQGLTLTGCELKEEEWRLEEKFK